MYRYYIEDPIRFRKSIEVTIEHGHANSLNNDYSSTAYYYVSKPKRGGRSYLRLRGSFLDQTSQPMIIRSIRGSLHSTVFISSEASRFVAVKVAGDKMVFLHL